MSAIEFVVRNSAGAINRGYIGGEGNAQPLLVEPGSDISLNLNQGQILSYGRSGTSLEITLVDGQVIVIENYFGLDGVPANELFISTSGSITEVNLIEGQGGVYYSTYTDADITAKWGPEEDMSFLGESPILLAGTSEPETGMLATGFLAGFPVIPALLAGGAAAAAAGTVLDDSDTREDEPGGEGDGGDGDGGDGDGDGDGGGNGGGGEEGDDDIDVTFDEDTVGGDGVVNGEEEEQGVVLTGSTDEGTEVVVTINGVDYEAVVEGEEWTLELDPGTLPQGEYDQEVIVTATDGNGNTATTEGTFHIDTLVNNLAVTSGPVTPDDIVNEVEQAGEITLSGTVEAGSTVIVSLAGVEMQATVTGTSWSVTYPAGAVPPGEYEAELTVTATDLAGNSATVSDTFVVDTEMGVTIDAPVEGNNVINRAEAQDGTVLTGTTDPGATVTITFAGVTQTVVAGSDGTWSVSYSAGQIPTGESMQDISVTATDTAGNVASVEHRVLVDTYVNRLTSDDPVEGDNIVNREEAGDGITLTGTVEAGSTVFVTFEGVTREASVSASGNWSVTFGPGEIPPGEYEAEVTIAATDAHGNHAVITDTFLVDTAPPEAPIVESYTRAGEGVRGITTTLTDEEVDLFAVASDGAVSNVGHDQEIDTGFNELSFDFDAPVPNGSHLVINASDASGNSTATLFVLEEQGTNVVDVTNSGLNGFDVEAIDLQFAEDAELTLSASDLESLCAHSNTLTIHGGADDTVRIDGATSTSETTEIAGKTYLHYELGDNGGTLIIDESINVIT